MKAIVNERYGSPKVLELRDVARPVPGANQVLVRIHAASVNRSDWETLTARPLIVRLSGAGFRRPKNTILGSDIAGTVESVGGAVTSFRPGDEVFGDIMWHGFGGFAEYVCVAETAPLVPKPENVTFEQAAALPQAAVLALQGLRDHVQPGDRVMINGAGGGAGTFAIQIAKALGAEVTGVDHTSKLDLMRSMGADHVIDYTRENFAKQRFDRILDFAAHRSIFTYRRALRPNGTYAMVGGSMPRLLGAVVIGALISRIGDKKLGLLVAKPNKEDLTYLAELVATGALTPVIDKHYELSEVPEALRYIGGGHTLGKVVISV